MGVKAFGNVGGLAKNVASKGKSDVSAKMALGSFGKKPAFGKKTMGAFGKKTKPDSAEAEAHGLLEGISSLHSWIKSQTMMKPTTKMKGFKMEQAYNPASQAS